MNYKLFPLSFVFVLLSFTTLSNRTNSIKISTTTEINSVSKNVSIYNQLDANSFVLPSFECFSMALDGFYLLNKQLEKTLTISSNTNNNDVESYVRFIQNKYAINDEPIIKTIDQFANDEKIEVTIQENKRSLTI